MKKFILAISLLFSTSALAQNYQATQGSGTTFGTKLVSAVNYPQFVVCDPTTPAQCVAVDASGRLSLIPNTAFNIAQINGVTPLMGNGVTGTGSQRVTIASDNTAFSVNAIQSGTWTVQPGNTANTTPWLASISQGGNTAIVKAGNTFAGTEQAVGVAVTNTLTAVTPGDGITTTIYGTAPASPVIGSPLLFNGSTYDRARSGGVTGMLGVSIQASPTGGCTPNGVITAGASTNATNVKASAGTLCDFSAANTTSTLYYVHFYNNAGTPTCNTGIIESYPVSAAPAVGQVGGWSRPFPQGHAYGTGIGICITANADGTGNAAAGVTLNIGYK